MGCRKSHFRKVTRSSHQPAGSKHKDDHWPITAIITSACHTSEKLRGCLLSLPLVQCYKLQCNCYCPYLNQDVIIIGLFIYKMFSIRKPTGTAGTLQCRNSLLKYYSSPNDLFVFGSFKFKFNQVQYKLTKQSTVLRFLDSSWLKMSVILE